MKTNQDGTIEYETTDRQTICGVTALRGMWAALGVDLYANTIERHGFNGPDKQLLMIAQDSLPADATGEQILRRYAAMAAKRRDLVELCAALRAIKISVPSNINVWQHLKGEEAMRKAADSVSEAVQALTDRLSE